MGGGGLLKVGDGGGREKWVFVASGKTDGCMEGMGERKGWVGGSVKQE